MRYRSTAVAREVDSSQLEGNCAVLIGRRSVWPSTTRSLSIGASTSPSRPSRTLPRAVRSASPASNSTPLVT